MGTIPVEFVEKKYNRITTVSHLYFNHHSGHASQYSCTHDFVAPATDDMDYFRTPVQVPTEWAVLDTGHLESCSEVWIKHIKLTRTVHPTAEEAEDDKNRAIEVRFGGGDSVVIRPGRCLSVEPIDISTVEWRSELGAVAELAVLPG